MKLFDRNKKNSELNELNDNEERELNYHNDELSKDVNVKRKQYNKLIIKFAVILGAFMLFSILFYASFNSLTKGFNFISTDNEFKKNNKHELYTQELSNFKKNTFDESEEISPLAKEIADLINSEDDDIKISSPSVEIIKEKTRPKLSQSYLDKITPDTEIDSDESDDKSYNYKLSKAVQLSLNSDYLLSENTVIKCNLMNDVLSTIDSQTKCLILKDVYSDNGTNVLIPKGSIASGKSQQGIIQGQNKMFIVWEKIKTPNGVIIPLDNSPSVDKMGAVGHQAKIKSNFLLRFGNALMISMLETAVGTGFDVLRSKKVEKVNIEVGQAQSNAEMGIETLKNSIDIDSVGLIKRGTIINILTNEDIDFSGVI